MEYSKEKLRILVSGSSGFIGAALVPFLKEQGHQIIKLVRHKKQDENSIYWDPSTGVAEKEEFEGFDAVIHLAGKNIGQRRWNCKIKQEIFLSRCRDTWLLSQILLRLYKPPKCFICASAIGIYGSQREGVLTEESSFGEGFLANLCAKWEEATQPIANRGTRVVNTRFGLILSPTGGMLGKMLPLFKLGLGATFGDGKQIISWVALEDVVRAIYHALMMEKIEGPVNVTAPTPVKLEEFVQAIAAQVHRPAVFRVPKGLLKWIFGEMADETLLASSYVVPKKLLDTGYQFQYPTLDKALDSFNLLKR